MLEEPAPQARPLLSDTASTMGEVVQWPTLGEQALRQRMRHVSVSELRRWLRDCETHLKQRSGHGADADSANDDPERGTRIGIRAREAKIIRTEIARREARRV